MIANIIVDIIGTAVVILAVACIVKAMIKYLKGDKNKNDNKDKN